MAEPVLTIQQILDKLNNGLSDKNTWVVIPGIFSLPGSKIENDKVSPFDKSLVLKSFINGKTGEIKIYLSKLTDEPETKNLKT